MGELISNLTQGEENTYVEGKPIRIDNALSFEYRNVGTEGHTFVEFFSEESRISQLILGPTENLQITQIGSDVVTWLRQRTGIVNLEVENADQNIGIITDTNKQNVFKILDLHHPSKEVPAWLQEDDNVFKQLEGHPDDQEPTLLAKRQAKQIVIEHIQSKMNGNSTIQIDENIFILALPTGLKGEVEQTTGQNLLSNYEYLVVQRSGEDIKFLSQRMGKPQIVASNLAELRVSKNGSGPQSLGKVIEETANTVKTGKIDGKKVKTQVVTRLERKLTGKVNSEEKDGNTVEAIQHKAFSALEADLGFTLSIPLREHLTTKQTKAVTKLQEFFDATYGTRDLHPLIDFNDLPDSAIDIIITNIQDRAFVKETYVQYRFRQHVQETAHNDATEYLERLGMNITGGEKASADFFRTVFSVVYNQFETEENFSTLQRLVTVTEEGDGFVLDDSNPELFIPGDLVKTLKDTKPELFTHQNVSLIISQYIFRNHMLHVGKNGINDASPAEFSLNFSQLSKQTAETIQREKERDVSKHGSEFLGFVRVRNDIRSTEGPFNDFPEVKIEYPPVVVKALGRLYAEYNAAFRPLVEANREWPTDYQYILTPDGTPINGWVQIDMNGLRPSVLEQLSQMDEDEVVEFLRKQTFEIENSLAMYGLLSDIFSQEGNNSAFKQKFRQSLDQLRHRHNKKIAILGVTEQKYQAMREAEFNKRNGETLSDEEIMDISGFDTLMGPDQFRAYVEYLEANGLESDYLFYVRASEPLAKLKDPTFQIEGSLLEDENIRRFIKAHTITFNIDSPDWNTDDSRRINDTKGYLESMRMAHTITTFEEFNAFMKREEITKADITSGKVVLRVKPGVGSYGCYGHLISNEEDFFSLLKQGLQERGSYVIQPEIRTPLIFNESDGIWYTYIDRNFFSFVNGEPVFMSGFRFFLPADSVEALEGRIHGAKDSVLAEIYSED